MKVKFAQLCPTLCNLMDYTVHGILQARILELVTFPSSGGSSQPRDQTQVSLATREVDSLLKCNSVDTEVKVKVAQSCRTLCYPKDYTVHGILQARTLEWVALRFPRGSSQPMPPALQVDSLQLSHKGRPRRTGLLYILQGQFYWP